MKEREWGAGDGKIGEKGAAKKLKNFHNFLFTTHTGMELLLLLLDDDDDGDVYVCTCCSKNTKKVYIKRSQSRELKNSSSTPPMSRHKSS